MMVHGITNKQPSTNNDITRWRVQCPKHGSYTIWATDRPFQCTRRGWRKAHRLCQRALTILGTVTEHGDIIHD